MKRSILNARLDAINDAQRRSIVALFLSTLASGCIMAGLWNSYLSWDRQWTQTVNKPAFWGQEQLVAEQIKSWLESNTVGVSLLGIRLSVSDAAVLGALILLIFSFYYCVCMRCQNYEIGSLLISAEKEPPETKMLILFRIRPWMIFTATSTTDAPYRKLYAKPKNQGRIPFTRAGLKLLSYLPAIAVFCIIASDVYFSFFYISPWRENNGSVWSSLTMSYRVQLMLMDTFGLLAGFLILRFCRHSLEFSTGILEMTEQLDDEVMEIESSAGVMADTVPQPQGKSASVS